MALILLGLWLVLLALKPRRRLAIAPDAQTGVFLRRRDVQRLARAGADSVDGVLTATASGNMLRVYV